MKNNHPSRVIARDEVPKQSRSACPVGPGEASPSIVAGQVLKSLPDRPSPSILSGRRGGSVFGAPGESPASAGRSFRFALQESRGREVAEFFALVLLGAAVPFFLRRPQLLVGSVVNFTLAVAALRVYDWRKTVPLIFLPGASAAASGFLFGPATPFLFYLLPFIWAGNALYVAAIRIGRKKGGVFLPVSLPSAALIKAAVIFLPASLLIRLGLVPAALTSAMGWIQLLTALIGGAAAFVLKAIAGGNGRGCGS